MRVFIQWLKANRVLFANASSLVGTTAVTSGLGFVYWWIAARMFSPAAIGTASASLSAMTLLGGGSLLGLDTLLITELPRQPKHAGSIISTALIVVSMIGTAGAFLFALGAAYISPDFQSLRTSFIDIFAFSIGVGGYSMTLVLDQALIGLLKGSLQFWRNTFFSFIKLVALFATSYWPSSQPGMKIYATWIVSVVLSLGFIATHVVVNAHWRNKNYMPQWSLLRKFSFSSIKHHILNITLQAPTLLLPVLVTMLLSARTNAWFYVSWMIASFIFVVPGAMTTVLHAMNAAQQTTLACKVRLTITVSLVFCVLANLVLQFGSAQVLSLFGNTYAAEASWSLRILALAAFPLIIKNHYISLCRIQERIVKATVGMLPGGALELVGAAFGAQQAGLLGLSLGWLGALAIEATLMLPTIYKVIQPAQCDPDQVVQGMSQQREVWLVDTAPLLAASNSFRGITDASCLSGPLFLPAGQSFPSTGNNFVRMSKCFNGNKISQLKPPPLQGYVPPLVDTPLVDMAEGYWKVSSTNEEGRRSCGITEYAYKIFLQEVERMSTLKDRGVEGSLSSSYLQQRTQFISPDMNAIGLHSNMDNGHSRINVLMVTPRYFPYMGGIETHVHEVGRRLQRDGVNVTLLTTVAHQQMPSFPQEDECEGMRILRVRAWPRQHDYYLAPEIYSVIKQGHWDLIHCQGCHTLVPPVAMLAAKATGIPYMLTFHTGGHSSPWRNKIRAIQWRVLHPLLKDAVKLIGVSQFEANYFHRLLRIPTERFTVIPNGASLPERQPELRKITTSACIISVGRLEKYKGHHRLITALPLIRMQRPDAHLLLLGAGPYERELRSLAQRVGVEEYVSIRAIAANDRQAMTEQLAQAALVALLSEYEAHPVAIMEALALRRSVLVTDTSGLRELAQQGLVRAIALNSPPEAVAEAAVASMNAPCPLPADFRLPTWDDCAHQIQAIYHTVVQGRKTCAS